MPDMAEPTVKNVIPDLPRKDLLFLDVLVETEVFPKRKTGLQMYHIIRNQYQSQQMAIRAQNVDFLQFAYQQHVRVKVHISVSHVVTLHLN
jgi:hypothetical protein